MPDTPINISDLPADARNLLQLNYRSLTAELSLRYAWQCGDPLGEEINDELKLVKGELQNGFC